MGHGYVFLKGILRWFGILRRINPSQKWFRVWMASKCERWVGVVIVVTVVRFIMQADFDRSIVSANSMLVLQNTTTSGWHCGLLPLNLS